MQDDCLVAGRWIVMASFATHEVVGIDYLRGKQQL